MANTTDWRVEKKNMIDQNHDFNGDIGTPYAFLVSFREEKPGTVLTLLLQLRHLHDHRGMHTHNLVPIKVTWPPPDAGAIDWREERREKGTFGGGSFVPGGERRRVNVDVAKRKYFAKMEIISANDVGEIAIAIANVPFLLIVGI
jgi:hypothetical protein